MNMWISALFLCVDFGVYLDFRVDLLWRFFGRNSQQKESTGNTHKYSPFVGGGVWLPSGRWWCFGKQRIRGGGRIPCLLAIVVIVLLAVWSW